jgi:hypothetical protein
MGTLGALGEENLGEPADNVGGRDGREEVFAQDLLSVDTRLRAKCKDVQ